GPHGPAGPGGGVDGRGTGPFHRPARPGGSAARRRGVIHSGGGGPGEGTRMRRGRPDLPVRLEALDRATTLLEQLDPATMPGTGPVQRARAVLDRTGQRQHLSGAHTVVAFAGATGSGKSSLVNAVSGTEAATVGARRPTTATAVGLYSGDA